jgi:hypothetical protein
LLESPWCSAFLLIVEQSTDSMYNAEIQTVRACIG